MVDNRCDSRFNSRLDRCLAFGNRILGSDRIGSNGTGGDNHLCAFRNFGRLRSNLVLCALAPFATTATTTAATSAAVAAFGTRSLVFGAVGLRQRFLNLGDNRALRLLLLRPWLALAAWLACFLWLAGLLVLLACRPLPLSRTSFLRLAVRTGFASFPLLVTAVVVAPAASAVALRIASGLALGFWRGDRFGFLAEPGENSGKESLLGFLFGLFRLFRNDRCRLRRSDSLDRCFLTRSACFVCRGRLLVVLFRDA